MIRCALVLTAAALLCVTGCSDGDDVSSENPIQTGCADPANLADDCDPCGGACSAGEFCVEGTCTRTCPATVCEGPAGAECVDLSSDKSHCGDCNVACGAGQACVNARCVQDCGALSECAGACVDLQSDAANCGECGEACAAGQACVNGACACPGGMEACGDACVDLASDPAHCGGCGQACGQDDACEGGACVGPDGCTERPVAGLSLRAVHAYQTVQIPIMTDGSAVAQRNADIVAGRKAVFRVHVAPEAGWTPRQVSARLELTDTDAPTPTQKRLFFGLLTPTGPSTDADLHSTIQVYVPADAIGPSTRYAVTLVECDGAQAGAAEATRARFPSEGYANLGARETGPLKVHIIPISGTNVTEEGLKPFKERLEAVYPVTDVQFTVGQPLAASASSMCALLASVSSRRSQDQPPNDVYYYGLAPGILGGQSGCSNTSTSPRAAKVSAGWAQGYRPDDGRTGAATMCHELGHAHGRFHAPCNVQDPDRRYPYPNADIGVWGYDQRTDEFYEPTRKDMMSYCPEPRWAAWISDYNYQAILERTIEVNGQAEVPAAFTARGAPVAYRLLVSDSAGVHWIAEPLFVRGTPEGEPLRAVIYGAHGPMQEVEVYVQQLDDGVSERAFMLSVPQPDPSWYGIAVPGLLDLQAF